MPGVCRSITAGTWPLFSPCLLLCRSVHGSPSSCLHRPLELARPFLRVLPEVSQADRKISFREKGLYTGIALFVFLVCSQLPLYGIKTNSGSDPFYWARVIMASNRYAAMHWTTPSSPALLRELLEIERTVSQPFSLSISTLLNVLKLLARRPRWINSPH